MLSGITLHQLQCFDALVKEGSFQAAAEKLHRSQPTISSSVKNLEELLGLSLLDRTGYRVSLTDAGRSFHQRTHALLRELESLKDHALQLTIGEESELSVVIGDLCPLPQTLGLLRQFFDRCHGTQLHLHFEAISGPWERLHTGEADLILHHIDKHDSRIEFIDLSRIKLVPVVAPGFLRIPISQSITHEQMRSYVQCIIRDTAQHSQPHDYYLLDGAQSWTVTDQLMKRELIIQGMGWGHLPHYLITQDLHEGRLLPITGEHFKGGHVELVAARRRNISHGPIANRLWQFITEQAMTFDSL